MGVAEYTHTHAHAGRQTDTHTHTHTCAHTYTEGVMGSLLSKLQKNDNNVDISLYQVYSPKLHKDILKYNGFILFKEIAIGFNHGPQMTSDPSVSFSDSLLV